MVWGFWIANSIYVLHIISWKRIHYWDNSKIICKLRLGFWGQNQFFMFPIQVRNCMPWGAALQVKKSKNCHSDASTATPSTKPGNKEACLGHCENFMYLESISQCISHRMLRLNTVKRCYLNRYVIRIIWETLSSKHSIRCLYWGLHRPYKQLSILTFKRNRCLFQEDDISKSILISHCYTTGEWTGYSKGSQLDNCETQGWRYRE